MADIIVDENIDILGKLIIGKSYHWHFKEAQWQFDYLVHPKKSDRLIILMPSAMSSTNRIVPSFHRHSWASLIDANVVVVSDPTLFLSENLMGGWFQGLKDDFILLRILKHIESIEQTLDIKRKNVVFCGSSLGGFGAIMAAIRHKGSSAYAENPQLNMKNYMIQSALHNLSLYCFNGNIADAFDEYPERFDVSAAIKSLGYCPPMYIVQKRSDEHHYNEHLLPFLQEMNKMLIDKNLFIIEEIGISIDKTGHTALVYPEMIARVNVLLSSFK